MDVEITDDYIQRTTADLSVALVRFSKEPMSKEKSMQIAKNTIARIDLNSEVFAHKGINWLAQVVLGNIK